MLSDDSGKELIRKNFLIIKDNEKLHEPQISSCLETLKKTDCMGWDLTVGIALPGF